MTQSSKPVWRHDIGALTFVPAGHGGFCAVHRLAFRTLLQVPPAPEACLAYFAAHEATFREAASAKIRTRRIAPGTNFHLTSRDVARLAK